MKNKLNILISYAYFTNDMIPILNNLKPDSFRLIIDSGAFTANSIGKHICLNEYIKFVKNFPVKCDELYFVQLDVIGSQEKSLVNYYKMLDADCKNILPVITYGGELTLIDELYKTSDYIMFGSLTHVKNIPSYLKEVSKIVGGRKVHWLGHCKTKHLRTFKPYSCDSSSYSSAARFGSLSLFFPNKTLDIRSNYKDRLLIKRLKSLSLSDREIARLSVKDSWRGGNIEVNIACKAAILSYIDLAKNISQHTNYYLAVSGAIWLKNIIHCYTQHKQFANLSSFG